MRRIVIAAALVASVAAGQYLEKTIWLPDSFQAVSRPENILYNSGSNTIYVGDGSRGGIVVLDGITLRKSAQVFLPHEPELMLYAPEVNKVYCTWGGANLVYVIDGAGHGILAVVPVGEDASDICYDPVTRRVYCASDRAQTLVAIDANGDTVVATVALPIGPEKMCCNWLGNKVYLADRSTGEVYVVDGRGDSVLTHMYVSEVPGQMLYNPLSNRVYCPDEEFYDVGIIDADADTLIRWITMGAERMGLCLNTSDNELYVTDGYDYRVIVICGNGDSLKSRIDIGLYSPQSPVYDSVSNRVYVVCRGGDSLVIIDAAGDTVLGRVKVGDSPTGLCIDTRQRRAFVANSSSHDVLVLDIPVDTIVADIDFWFGPTVLAYCSEQDKLYGTSLSVPSAVVVDAGTNSVLRHVDLGMSAGEVLCPAGVSKVYVGCLPYSGRDTLLWVIDAAADTVLTEVPVGLRPHNFAFRPGGPGEAKVYCANRGSESVSVIDVGDDSVVAKVGVSEYPIAATYGQDVDAVFVLCTYPGRLFKIDCSADTVATHYDAPSDAHALVYLEGRRIVCVASAGSVWVLDAEDLSPVWQYWLGTTPTRLAYCWREQKVYCATQRGFLYVVDMVSRWIDSVPAAEREKGLLYDSLANRLYCISESEGTAQVLDCATDSVLCVLQLGERPVAAAWSPLWRRVYVANSTGSSISVIQDSITVGIAEGVRQTRGARVTQTVVRGVLHLGAGHNRNPPGDFGSCPKPVLVDITGRTVMDLKPGENDVRHLAPGVYFVWSAESGKLSSVRKVVIQK